MTLATSRRDSFSQERSRTELIWRQRIYTACHSQAQRDRRNNWGGEGDRKTVPAIIYEAPDV